MLIGGSGSGKTTLPRLVAGLARADGGMITLRGEPVDRADPDRAGHARFVPAQRRRVGMVSQDFALWPHLGCIDNIIAATRGDPATRAMDLVDRLGMASLAPR